MSNKIVTTKKDGIRALESTPEIDDEGNLFVGATEDTASAKDITCHTLNYENLNPLPRGEGVKWIETGGGNQTNSEEHAVSFYDAQTHSAMENFPTPTSVASQPLFSGTAKDNKLTLGINSKAFRNGTGTLSAAVMPPTRIEDNFKVNSTALNSNYYLPGCDPLNSPLPDIVNNMKWLSIQDNAGNTFYIPAYYNDSTIVEQANILIDGSTEEKFGIVYENGTGLPVVFNISTSYPPNQSTTIDINSNPVDQQDVRITDSNGTPITSLTFTPTNYSIGQTIKFEAINDSSPEPFETIIFTLKGITPSHWNGVLPNENTIRITVTDDDNISANILINGKTDRGEGTVNEGTFNIVSFNISTSNAPNQTTIIKIDSFPENQNDVRVTNSNGTPITSLTFTPTNYSIGETIRFQAIDDIKTEILIELITFTLSAETASHWNGGSPTNNRIDISVVDDDQLGDDDLLEEQ